jgi:hypothetical protein
MINIRIGSEQWLTDSMGFADPAQLERGSNGTIPKQSGIDRRANPPKAGSNESIFDQEGIDRGTEKRNKKISNTPLAISKKKKAKTRGFFFF